MYTESLFFRESFGLFRCINIGFMIMYILLKSFVNPYMFISLYLMMLGFLVFFYRVPRLSLSSKVKENDRIIISPCQGKVMRVTDLGKEYHIAIFLNIFDVHLQYYPVSGTIVKAEHVPGRFHPAYMFEKSEYNERFITTIEMDNKEHVKVVQIAGQVARRIVNRSVIGEKVDKGERMGMIKLSSRVDVYLPKKNYVLLVREGDYVKPYLQIAYKVRDNDNSI